jgi:hypothetical protein
MWRPERLRRVVENAGATDVVYGDGHPVGARAPVLAWSGSEGVAEDLPADVARAAASYVAEGALAAGGGRTSSAKLVVGVVEQQAELDLDALDGPPAVGVIDTRFGVPGLRSAARDRGVSGAGSGGAGGEPVRPIRLITAPSAAYQISAG